jgi:cytochrome c oxidase cbb3-type subunit 1
MLALAAVLAIAFVRRRAENVSPARPSNRWPDRMRFALLAALFAVPFTLYWAASPRVYPPFNPSSGGATGSSLLGSTLGIVAIFCLTPFLASVRVRGSTRVVARTFALLALNTVVFALAGHGYRSNHELAQIAALATLLVWPLLLAVYWRQFSWPPASRRWLFAFAAWGTALVVSAWITFLPAVLERWKFTNALVGHAHAAMAGMISSFLMIVLVTLNEEGSLSATLSDRVAFALWQAGCVLHVVSLMAAGSVEAANPAAVFVANDAIVALYAARWLGGALMLGASVRWLSGALRPAAEGARS